MQMSRQVEFSEMRLRHKEKQSSPLLVDQDKFSGVRLDSVNLCLHLKVRGTCRWSPSKGAIIDPCRMALGVSTLLPAVGPLGDFNIHSVGYNRLCSSEKGQLVKTRRQAVNWSFMQSMVHKARPQPSPFPRTHSLQGLAL